MNPNRKTKMRILYFSLSFAILAALAGCSATDQSVSGAKLSPLAELTADQQIQKDLAIEAKDKLATSLMGELMKSMGERGPAKSISVCQTLAPEIAEAVSKESGVRIGRTSFRLRNKNNQPPGWATQCKNRKTCRSRFAGKRAGRFASHSFTGNLYAVPR